MKITPIQNWLPVLFLAFLPAVTVPAQAQIRASEHEIMSNSVLTMSEIMQIPMKGIPSALFRKAEGIAIIPGMMKGGFVVGIQRGRGVFVVKKADGTWENPRFITLTGGSIGLQAGVQSADVILVFCTRRSVQSALNGHFTVGVDATIAAGPVGRQATAGTDIRLTSEIYSYSRSRGIFLGAAIDGSKMELDNHTTSQYYADSNNVPPAAKRLTNIITRYSGKVNLNDLESIRLALCDADAEMKKSLDPQWKTWLELPSEVTVVNGKPEMQKLKELQQRYYTVLSDPKYENLYMKEEFQTTRELLINYISVYEEELQKQNAPVSENPLPPPPVTSAPTVY
ncbi:MAG: lipid-binding SYLF domain-containing protein [Planctomycetia bacterium]|nr:lipid-binding SYLF domain-containing protein [Planctomycetia bacterium]